MQNAVRCLDKSASLLALRLAVDGNGDLWVSDDDNAVNGYSPTASGAATPIASMFGADTDLRSPQGLMFDSSGNLVAIR